MKKLAVLVAVLACGTAPIWCRTLPTGPVPPFSSSLEQQADAGDDASQQALAYDYYFGKGVKQSFEKAAEWYKRSANSGNPSSAFSVAFMYERGQGLPAGTQAKPRDAAFPYYLQAAQAGLGDAMLKVAKDYDSAKQGEFPGVPAHDHASAKIWYARAQNSGVTKKAHNHPCPDYWEVGLSCQ